MENPLYFSEPFNRSLAWIDLLLLANHTNSFFFKRGVKVEVERGQIGYDLDSLAKRWKWSRGKVERFIKFLENDNQIVRQKTNVTTLISIVNYKDYQNDDKANDKPNSKADNKPNSKSNSKANGNKQECKEEKECKEGKEINNNTNIQLRELDFSKFDNLEIVQIWNDWIEYKKNQFKKTYASEKSEQIALNELCKISNGKSEIAKEIVQKSIASLYQGLFELKENNLIKNNQNATSINFSKPTITERTEAARQRLNREREEFLNSQRNFNK